MDLLRLPRHTNPDRRRHRRGPQADLLLQHPLRGGTGRRQVGQQESVWTAICHRTASKVIPSSIGTFSTNCAAIKPTHNISKPRPRHLAGVYCTGVGITEQQLAMQQRSPTGQATRPGCQLPGPQVILESTPHCAAPAMASSTATTTPATLTKAPSSAPQTGPCPDAFCRSPRRRAVITENTTVVAIEGLFYAQNVKTALVMGQARGAAITTVAKAGLEVFEIGPRKVKQAIVGFGGTKGGRCQDGGPLGLPELPEPDAADAPAIALTFSLSAGASSGYRYQAT